jgi:DUF2934 family protein
MPGSERNNEEAIRERAYFIWESEGRPEGRAQDHWQSATLESLSHERDDEFMEDDDEFMEDEEKVLAGRADANIPAMLTKDVRGG